MKTPSYCETQYFFYISNKFQRTQNNLGPLTEHMIQDISCHNKSQNINLLGFPMKTRGGNDTYCILSLATNAVLSATWLIYKHHPRKDHDTYFVPAVTYGKQPNLKQYLQENNYVQKPQSNLPIIWSRYVQMHYNEECYLAFCNHIPRGNETNRLHANQYLCQRWSGPPMNVCIIRLI